MFSHLWQTCLLQPRSSLSVLELWTGVPNITHRARKDVRVFFSPHQPSRSNLSSSSSEGVSPSTSGMWKYSFQCTCLCGKAFNRTRCSVEAPSSATKSGRLYSSIELTSVLYGPVATPWPRNAPWWWDEHSHQVLKSKLYWWTVNECIQALK